MQNINEAITKRIHKERAEKIAELHQKQEDYIKLIYLASQIECKYENILVDRNSGIRESHYFPQCHRCQLKNQANSIHITVHE